MQENIEYIQFFSINIFVFKVMGFWKPDKDMPKKHLYNLYTLLCTVAWVSFVISQTVYMIKFFTSINELTSVLYTAVTFTIDLIKMIAIYNNMDLIKSWLKKLNKSVFQPKCEEHSMMALATKKSHSNLFWVCFYMGVQTYLFFSFIPFLRDETATLTQGWFPFDWRRSPNYEIIYAFQNSVTLWNTVICLNLVTFSTGLLSQISLQCDYLSVTLRSLNMFRSEDGVLRENDESNIKFLQGNPQEFSKVMTENLIVCIEHYEKIKGLSREIENIHHTSIFILFLGGGVIICSGLFQLTLVREPHCTDTQFDFLQRNFQVEIGGLEFFMLISFLMCMLTEQFIYCWFGNDIIYKSAQISNAAYNTPWTECDLRFKKILLQFLIQTKKPIQIKVGGLFAMSIDAFKSVVQSSYSYFTLLKRLQDMS